VRHEARGVSKQQIEEINQRMDELARNTDAHRAAIRGGRRSRMNCQLFAPPTGPPPGPGETKQTRKRSPARLEPLKYVYSRQIAANKCQVVIEYDGEHFIGTLLFTDSLFCQQMAKRLQYQIGRSIKEIGDLDLSGTL
jgi:hypothetical protein